MTSHLPENTRAEHELSLQLNANAIDFDKGLIRGATVGQAGVEATGKFVLLDKDGNLTRDPKLAVKKLKVVTDEETLNTIMTAAAKAGGVLKIRSDHDDSLEARAGYADNFVKIAATASSPARVTADLHLNDSYRDRDIVLETAKKTPKLIGLSIDMTPSFELVGACAVMRVEELLAVDIVDAGAITHEGLFLSRGVDKTPTVRTRQPDPLTHMAEDNKAKEPTVADCMAAVSALTATVTSLASAVGKMASPADAGKEQLSAALKPLTEQLSAVNETVLTLKKEQAAMGLKIGTAPTAADAAAETERLRLAAEKAKNDTQAGKTYLQLVDDTVAASNGKLKRSEAHQQVMTEHREKYAAYQKGLGVYDPAKDPARANG